MKLEQILPRLREGRAYRDKGGTEWSIRPEIDGWCAKIGDHWHKARGAPPLDGWELVEEKPAWVVRACSLP